MQYPVPQFTDVEDKIIGPLTVKQFGILFSVGIVVFLAYSVTKSLAAGIVVFVLVGLPGLALALVPYNGRPMYNFIGQLFKFSTAPKVLVFHKEVRVAHSLGAIKTAKLSQADEAALKAPPAHKANLEEVEDLLSRTASEEREVARKIK